MVTSMLLSLERFTANVLTGVKPVAARQGCMDQAKGRYLPIGYPCLSLPTRTEDLDPRWQPNHVEKNHMGQAAPGTGRSLRYSGSRGAARYAARAVLSRDARSVGVRIPSTATVIGLSASPGGSVGSGTSGLLAERIGQASSATWATTTAW